MKLAPFKNGPHQHSTCTVCAQEIYLNLNARRTVREWCHRWSGSRWCDLQENSVANPQPIKLEELN